MPDVETPSPTTSVSGRKVVAAMLALGIGITGLLFLYWNLHLMPFMPLQEAIVREFPKSAPRVEGGRRKMHQGTPMILRVVLRVPFDPSAPNDSALSELNRYLDRIRALATQHVEITDYELLEVNFYHPIQEKEIREKLVRRSFSSWEDVKEDGTPAVSVPNSTAPSSATPGAPG